MNKSLKISFILLALLCSSLIVFAKRMAPKPVESITYQGIEYRVTHDLMGCVEAWHLQTGVRIWWKQTYVVKYDPKSETDVQDVFIKSMVLKDKNLIIRNEKDQVYILNLSTLEVKEKSFQKV